MPKAIISDALLERLAAVSDPDTESIRVFIGIRDDVKREVVVSVRAKASKRQIEWFAK